MPGMACFANADGAYIAERFFVHFLFPVEGHSLVIAFACSNLRWVIEILPPQTGVYVPRRLSHVSGPLTRLGPTRGRRGPAA